MQAGSRWLAWLALALGIALPCASPVHALPRGTRVDPSLVLEVRELKFKGSSFEQLSAHLYGGDRRYAKLLRSLNPGMREVDRSRTIRYAAPQARLQRGQTMQVFGAYWAGGSARSYRLLLPLNPWIQDPDDVPVGAWITLPSIPSAAERRKFEAEYIAKNVKPKAPPKKLAGKPKEEDEEEEEEEEDEEGEERTPAVRATAPGAPAKATPSAAPAASAPGVSSIYEPKTNAERLEFVQWYLDKIDLKENPTRAEALVKDLLERAPGDWNSYYVAGQFYVRTERHDRAAELFEVSLRDPKSPIQAALFFLRSSRKAGKTVDPKVTATLYGRYPALESLMEAEQAE
jgi:hypothetical protein